MDTLGVDASIHADKWEELTWFFVDASAKMLVWSNNMFILESLVSYK